MALFEALVALHVITGTVGLTAFWGPIVTRKGAANHRKWGKAACYGFLGAGALAIAMALLSSSDTQRSPTALCSTGCSGG